MKFKPSEIEHPIKMYIRRDLGITVEQFGKLAGIPQSTLATWIKRNRRVEKLPINFYSALAIVGRKKIEVVYADLLSWQQKYDQYIQERLQKIADEKSLFVLAAKEGKKVAEAYRAKNQEDALLEPVKRLGRAVEKLDSDRFIQTMIEIYGEIAEPIPTWLAKTVGKKQVLKEVGQAFYNEVLINRCRVE
ncbi:hypothetical protein NRIC_27800 [Enterococcus florum]|uniref:Uncharacterized protein n=1 Tax=Enterococcus florum TaxID=2480627 RepID=A0A4V0WPS6_9ENTE|nr:hypothetical protein [Enterococcus florum]GCF94889.1 hypothetical protein NRIC_27800 [Enterococcus florum]